MSFNSTVTKPQVYGNDNDEVRETVTNQDDDFRALLGGTTETKTTTTTRTTTRTATTTQEHDLNLDHLTREKQDISPPRMRNSDVYNRRNKTGNKNSMYFGGGGSDGMYNDPRLHRLSSYVSMLCYFYPGICGTLTFMVIGLILFGLGTLIFNPTLEYGVMKHDHTFLESKYNLKVGDIDHWCLRGDNNACQCEDPLVPRNRADRKSWRLAFKVNRKIVKRIQETAVPVDLVFLGESVVEEMDGRWMGQGRSPALQEMAKMFESRFVRTTRKSSTTDANGDNNNNKKEGNDGPPETSAATAATITSPTKAKLNAIALGIAGDTSSNVLWRLMHGEMDIQPKIWWLSLGMNDLARLQCSEEVVVLGILRVVEEIMDQQPDAHIVINSLFPMSRIRGAMYPTRNDYKDSLLRSTGAIHHPQPNNNINDNGGGRGGGARFLLEQEEERLTTTPRTTRSLWFGNKNDADNVESEAGMTEEKAADAEDARYEKRARQHGSHFPFFHFSNQNNNNNNINNRHPIDPVLMEQHKVRKHIRDAQLPLWTSVLVVNRELRNFAATHDQVTFFDATPIFTQRATDGSHHIVLHSELISIMGHPTRRGFDLWEKAAADTALNILKETKKQDEDGSHAAAGDTTTTMGGNSELFDDDYSYNDDAMPNLNDALNFDEFGTDDDFEDDAFFGQTDDFPIMPTAGGQDGQP